MVGGSGRALLNNELAGEGGGLVPLRAARIAELSFGFVLDSVSGGIPGLKTLEALLMMAVNQANIAPLTRDPVARARYGALSAPAPDHERRPVSVRALASSLQLPYETARRNVRSLEQRGVLRFHAAGVIVPADYMVSEPYIAAAIQAHARLQALYAALEAAGLLEPLATPNYDEPEPPVRAAVRFVSDYLLRTAEAVVGRTQELVSGLALLPVLTAAAAAVDSGTAAPQSVAALTRRLGMPAETVRRHAAGLVAAGVCQAGPGGLVMPRHVLEAPAWRGLLEENAVNVQRMFAGLAERGVIAAWARTSGLDAPAPARGAA